VSVKQAAVVATPAKITVSQQAQAKVVKLSDDQMDNIKAGGSVNWEDLSGGYDAPKSTTSTTSPTTCLSCSSRTRSSDSREDLWGGY
jgi:hypothetical protein